LRNNSAYQPWVLLLAFTKEYFYDFRSQPVSGVGIKDPGLVTPGHADDNVGAVHGVDLVILWLILVSLFRPGSLAQIGLRLAVPLGFRFTFGLTFRLGFTLWLTFGF
jgi:hypothetical protein